MQLPNMLKPQPTSPDTTVLPSFLPVPGVGVLPVNAFLIRGQEPLLVDTGLAALREEFLQTLRSVIDPETIRWIWLTHIDLDHTGNLAEVLRAAPRATVVTSFVGLAKLGLLGYQLERFRLLNPGQELDIGDRRLLAVRPATFDAPETTGFFDPTTRTLFSSDSFGAVMSEPAETAGAIDPQALRSGVITWSTIDAPWLQDIDRSAFAGTLERIAALGADTVLSSHLPPARDMTHTLLDSLSQAPGAEPFVGMDQEAFESLMGAGA